MLSACNTAADDGSGEALSGLARAFFYAGAASLLVSQWSVDDVATRVLMTEVFRRQADDPALPRAEALRQGMLAVMTRAQGKTAYFAHPYAWAPFMLVGEGGRGTAVRVRSPYGTEAADSLSLLNRHDRDAERILIRMQRRPDDIDFPPADDCRHLRQTFLP